MSELTPPVARREDERKAGQGGESPEDQQDPCDVSPHDHLR